jgi:hypothetical protein
VTTDDRREFKFVLCHYVDETLYVVDWLMRWTSELHGVYDFSHAVYLATVALNEVNK